MMKFNSFSWMKSPVPVPHLDRPVVSPDLGCREAARGASLLLDVESHLKIPEWYLGFGCILKSHTVPHLLQIVCVLLRRFPKELVPLVILRPHTTTLKHVGSWSLGPKIIRAQIEGPFSFQHTSPYSDNWGSSAQNFSFWKNHLKVCIKRRSLVQTKIKYLRESFQKTRMISCSQIFAI